MNERKMDLDEIVEVAKWFATEYKETNLLDIYGWDDDARVQVTIAGLSEIAPPETWEWSNREDEENPFAADVVVNGVTFFAIFTPEERDEITRGELPIDK